ncbi:copper chaperone PCu(A)C [Gilvimarinus sp. SDUM040013]|uniref:Copper chaperone PCu(A)C n=1 Tax=Gilvimarinus gilvus TaxID=3058038 RepID=A0ABU4RSI8_9GAMM|nr:copper chaperone PCu(A)C [Gilvimarinus sp. SDUM040013]MDO3388308.1 copper chaperone PCu(A)C [Gilvimarinus sp. SDUM040013]MDX6847858.1 copper chaperone PCu(A)C [Gilvimarinus sp. SDUM040013]
MKYVRLLLWVVCCWSMTAVGSESVSVSDGYVQLPVPGQTRAAAFMVLQNEGESLTLASVSCSCASKVEIHSHTHSDGVMKMRREDALPLPSRQTVTLAPGGWHMMLFDLNPAVRSGQHVELQLTYSDDSVQIIKLPVQSIFDGDDHQHHH